MNPNEFHKYFRWCNDRGVRIYPVLHKSGGYKISVERNGVEKPGKLVFYDVAPKGGISVWDKIRELYKLIYDKEYKPKENLNP